MSTEYAGALIIEWPDPGDFSRAVAGWLLRPLSYQGAHEPELLKDVTALTVHAKAKDIVTATVTRSLPTGDPDEPFRSEESVWLVVGCRVSGKS